jgi:histidinol-phosphate aminotransferase
MMMKDVTTEDLGHFLSSSLLNAPSYHIDKSATPVKLDQNESPFDWPSDIKERVLKRVATQEWNRYPSPFADHLGELLAKDLGIKSNEILIGPGSNYLVALAMSTFTQNPKTKVVVARPSFALYESHCKYEDIHFEPWNLNDDLEYDVKNLPSLDEHTVVVFASPNNPVGNILPKQDFKKLLSKYPTTYWIADEAYCEFTNEDYLDLLAEHSNLLLIRTLSKSYAAAGIRVGYIVAASKTIEQLRKLRLPYLLNPLSVAASEEILTSASVRKNLEAARQQVIDERRRIRNAIEASINIHGFSIKESHANFILLRWTNHEECLRVYGELIEQGVLIRNVSGAPGLKGCLRATLGRPEENDAFLKALSKALANK